MPKVVKKEVQYKLEIDSSATGPYTMGDFYAGELRLLNWS
jgi:hypothetical protein